MLDGHSPHARHAPTARLRCRVETSSAQAGDRQSYCAWGCFRYFGSGAAVATRLACRAGASGRACTGPSQLPSQLPRSASAWQPRLFRRFASRSHGCFCATLEALINLQPPNKANRSDDTSIQNCASAIIGSVFINSTSCSAGNWPSGVSLRGQCLPWGFRPAARSLGRRP